MDKLWQVKDPDLDWYKHVFVDGRLRDAMQLPLVDCPRCPNAQVSGRTLPFACPPEIREEAEALETEARNSDSVTVPLEKFRRYAARWEAALRRHGHDVRLLPGDAFPPRLWELPSIPRYDFYWPSIGHTAVVSERIARLFQKHGVSGMFLRPIVLAKVGTVQPTDEVLIPKSGDMTDYFNEFPSLDDPSACGNFFELLVSHVTRHAPEDGVVIDVCSGCGVEDWDESAAYKRRKSYYRKRKILPRRYVPDVDVFGSHIFYEGLVVGPKVYALLSEEDLRNCRTVRLTVCDDA